MYGHNLELFTITFLSNKYNSARYRSIPQVTVENRLRSPVHVQTQLLDGGPFTQTEVIHMKSSKTFTSHPSFLLIAIAPEVMDMHTGAIMPKFIDGSVIKSHTNITVDNVNKNTVTVVGFKRMINERMALEVRRIRQWLTWHTRRHLINMKQYKYVQSLTRVGHALVELPENMFDQVLAYYRQYKNTDRKHVVCNEGDAILSPRNKQVMCFEIPFKISIKTNILLEYIRQRAEAFCECQLAKQTNIKIMDYTQGNVQYRSLGSVADGGIMVRVPIQDGLRSGSHWRLELTDIKGSTNELHIPHRQMLIYEPCKVMLARPVPLEQHQFAELLILFTPASGWDYKEESVMRDIQVEVVMGKHNEDKEPEESFAPHMVKSRSHTNDGFRRRAKDEL